MAKKTAKHFFSPTLILLISLVVLATAIAFSKRELVPTASSSLPKSTSSTVFIREIDLPSPVKTGKISLEQAINQRRSQRKFQSKSITLKQLSQLLWSLQGVTADWGERTTPTFRSVYPLEVYLVAVDIDNLSPGIYRYLPGNLKPVHKLGEITSGKFAKELVAAAKQTSVQNTPAAFIITGNSQKVTQAFGEPSQHNIYLEAGHAAQNLYLQVQGLGLGTININTFDEALTYKLIGSPINEKIIYLLPVGYPDEI